MEIGLVNDAPGELMELLQVLRLVRHVRLELLTIKKVTQLVDLVSQDDSALLQVQKNVNFAL